MSDLRESAGATDHSQLYDPIPYGFLEDRGHDISGIKNDTLQADSVAYTKENEPNHLYIATRAETAADRPYYTCYTLRYTLSDLEMTDLKLVHDGDSVHVHIEAPLFIQELSYQKTPTVLSEAKIIVDAYNFMLEFLLRYNDITSNLYGNENIALDFVSFSKENNSVVINLRDDHSNSLISEAEIRTANLVPSLGATIETKGDNIYVAPHMVSFGTDEEMQNYMNNVTTVTYFYGYCFQGGKNFAPYLHSWRFIASKGDFKVIFAPNSVNLHEVRVQSS